MGLAGLSSWEPWPGKRKPTRAGAVTWLIQYLWGGEADEMVAPAARGGAALLAGMETGAGMAGYVRLLSRMSTSHTPFPGTQQPPCSR